MARLRLEPLALPDFKVPEFQTPMWQPIPADMRKGLLDLVGIVAPESLRGVYDPEKGVSLTRARYFFARQDNLQELAELMTLRRRLPVETEVALEWDDFQRLDEKISDAIRRLEQHTITELEAQKLYGTGYDNRARLDAPAAEIYWARWSTLNIDWNNSRASAPGLEITNICIFEAHAACSEAAPLARRFSERQVKEWFLEWVQVCEKRGNIPSRGEDLTAARAKFGDAVSRDFLRGLRREHAPLSWIKRGRRKQ